MKFIRNNCIIHCCGFFVSFSNNLKNHFFFIIEKLDEHVLVHEICIFFISRKTRKNSRIFGRSYLTPTDCYHFVKIWGRSAAATAVVFLFPSSLRKALSRLNHFRPFSETINPFFFHSAFRDTLRDFFFFFFKFSFEDYNFFLEALFCAEFHQEFTFAKSSRISLFRDDFFQFHGIFFLI